MLNSQQRLAVEHGDTPLLIVAGAGAGKTHTLTERIVYLIEQGADPAAFLCATFTNKASKEMRERIFRRLGVDPALYSPYRGADLPLVGTFHSLGVYFLRTYGEAIGLPKSFSLYDEDDRSGVIRGICSELDIDDKELSPRQIGGAISMAKNQGLDAHAYRNGSQNFKTARIADIFDRYERTLTDNSALDFDDILLATWRLLSHEETLTRFHERYRYIFVDEYQDTNEIQYRIVKLLARKYGHITVVGDDWQGIYSWRGANIRNMLSFQKDFAHATVIKLEQNYRSTKTILECANTLIKHNAQFLDKTLWTDNPDGEKITVIETYSERDEAEAVARLIHDTKAPYSEWAIIYRTNGQSRAIEEALVRRAIPYRVYGGVKFYERKEIKDMLAYLRHTYNPDDTISLKRIINVPARKIGEKSVSVLTQYADGYRMPLSEILGNIDEIAELPVASRAGLREFVRIMRNVREYARTNSVREVLSRLIESVGYMDYLTANFGEEEAEGKKDNLREFLNLASRYDGLEPSESYMLFLEEIALMTDKGEQAMADTVSLMTAHVSKGLEFGRVIIVGAEDGIFPHSRVLLEPREMEEERRLMYVAMTRAKKHLTITRARERFTFGTYTANPPSRFLKEIPETLLDIREDTVSRSRDMSRMFASSGLSIGSGSPSMKSPSVHAPTVRAKRTDDLSLGQKVEHPQFGIGTIVSLRERIAEIAFGGAYGVRKLNIDIAPLRGL